MPYTLLSPRLKATVASAGEAYAGKRFDASAHVIQVELDGRYTFCQPEQTDPAAKTTGGLGLMAEFYWPDACNAAAPGASFIKPGIGVLQKPDEKGWSPYGAYPLVQGVKRVERAQPDGIFFDTDFVPGWDGYAYHVCRRVWLEDASLRVETRLDNLGEKPLTLTEYNHNFVAVNGALTGPGLVLRVPGASFGALSDPLSWDGEAITFTRVAREAFFAGAESVRPAPYAWEMTCGGIGLRERLDVPAARFAVWGLAHALTPEVFVGIDLAPGSSMRWTRTWDFFASNP